MSTKFDSGYEKTYLSSSQALRNPWSTTSTYIDVGSLGNVISLAENSGLLGKEQQKGDPLVLENTRTSSSIKLIEQLEVLGKLRKELNEVKLIIHKLHLEQETKDLTNPTILDAKTKKMNELALHFSGIVGKKDELVNRLQQPFVGDYIRIDAEYHRYVAEAVPCLARVLSNLTTYLNTLTWSRHFSLEDGQMEKILGHVSSALAQIQGFFQSMCATRNLMAKLRCKDK